jgi:transglutaminase-like putative cysteine protease
VLFLVVFAAACNIQNTTPPPATPTQSPPTSTPKPGIVYQPAFEIDYTHPEQYLTNGEQTSISSPEALDLLRSDEKSIVHLQQIFRWLKNEFEPYSAGGKTIGVVTTDQLLEERRLGGCNDHGLVYAAAVRELGYPAVMVFTASIAWMELHQAGEAEQHIGHVFVEVYLNGRWVLIDSTNGWYVDEGYDPSDPVIPLKGSIAGSSEEVYGFYVTHKGIDQWDLGIYSPQDRFVMMEEAADEVDLESIKYPVYDFGSLRGN